MLRPFLPLLSNSAVATEALQPNPSMRVVDQVDRESWISTLGVPYSFRVYIWNLMLEPC